MPKKITGTDLEEQAANPYTTFIFSKHKGRRDSATLRTILLSYGVRRNHKIVLDPGLADMHWPAPLKLNEVSSLVKSDEAKIFVSRIRFNKGQVNFVFPKQEAKYITIVRHPVSLGVLQHLEIDSHSSQYYKHIPEIIRFLTRNPKKIK